MDTRIAIIAIVVEIRSMWRTERVLHKYSEYIIGRMGIPYQKRNISLISVAIDAPADVISSLSGKIGMLKGINAKTVYSKLSE